MLLFLSFAESSNASEPIFAHEQGSLLLMLGTVVGRGRPAPKRRRRPTLTVLRDNGRVS